MKRTRRLTDEQALAIIWAPPGWNSAFGRAYGISTMVVSRIRRGEVYKHLQVRG